jgi:hypothetical protein
MGHDDDRFIVASCAITVVRQLGVRKLAVEFWKQGSIGQDLGKRRSSIAGEKGAFLFLGSAIWQAEFPCVGVAGTRTLAAWHVHQKMMLSVSPMPFSALASTVLLAQVQTQSLRWPGLGIDRSRQSLICIVGFSMHGPHNVHHRMA